MTTASAFAQQSGSNAVVIVSNVTSRRSACEPATLMSGGAAGLFEVTLRFDAAAPSPTNAEATYRVIDASCTVTSSGVDPSAWISVTMDGSELVGEARATFASGSSVSTTVVTFNAPICGDVLLEDTRGCVVLPTCTGEAPVCL